ncbi:Inactive protein kinase [Morus notabilis]|uniref:non-specific serine/threonine protein kinase n=1 Tax=Morus notabilis TaxID=981085 RepID=W9SCQ5_9ROSA|nr:Inactive protein kinase [Morus notabilis]
MEGDIILVAVDASKEITDCALEWAVRNVASASDSLILLALLPSQTCLLKKFGIGCSKKGSSSDDIVLINGVHHDVFERINNVFSHMMQELCSAHDLMQVHTEVKIVADVQLSLVALKAKELQATWVILDRHLKRESDYCVKLLNCNIVLMDHAMPKILKAVNLPTVKSFNKGNHQIDESENDMSGLVPRKFHDYISNVTTQSSLDAESPIFDTDMSCSLSSPSTSNLIPYKNFLDLNSQYFHEKVEAQVTFKKSHLHSKFQPFNKASNFVTGKSHPKLLANNPLYEKNNSFDGISEIDISKEMEEVYGNITQKAIVPPRRSVDSASLRQNLGSSHSSKHMITIRDSISDNKTEPLVESSTSPTINRTSSVRKAMSLYIKQPPNPPPLCSICKHNAPIFGKSPRKFSFKEIERATNGFSSENFLAEGGFGPVHKGVLPDGQVVAVKQHKMLSAQGASEFCSEVEVLSCAQHRNLVMLVGYCTETEWLLVYEFACNGSLDKHLYGTERKELMSWENRMKVAIGAARGLRYLHEDCRVGCIVHRDFRPNNILLTHDFEPMVGDFGLARWQVDGQSAEETRVIGALGYLAPEYTQSGLITEKADVYAFGVVLLELLSGFNVTEFSRRTGQQQKPSLCSSQDANSSQATDQPSPPRISGRRENQHSTIKPKNLSKNQPEVDDSEEYQAYLRNSLAKFVQNLNGN